jgi:hypothetical protein
MCLRSKTKAEALRPQVLKCLKLSVIAGRTGVEFSVMKKAIMSHERLAIVDPSS